MYYYSFFCICFGGGTIIVLHNRHLRVLGVAFACIVPSRQLLVEEAAEDVRALGYGCGGFVQEVSAGGGESGGGATTTTRSQLLLDSTGWPLMRISLNSLEIEVDDDVVEVPAAVEALQVLCCDGDPAFQRRRRKLD